MNNKKELENLAPIDQARRLRVITPFFKACVCLGKILAANQVESQEIGRATLRGMLNALEAGTSQENLIRVLHALTPTLIHGLSHADYDIRKNTLIAIAEIAQKGFKMEGILPAIVERLDDNASWVADTAAATLDTLALYEWDLGPHLPRLEVAAIRPSESMRYCLSRAISHHMQNLHIEPPLAVVKKATELPGSWTVEISHRRMYATSDTPLNFSPEVPFHICGACGSAHLVFIYYDSDVGNVWKFIKHEYLCRDCRKYSLYEIND